MGIDWNVVFFVNFLLLYPNRRPHFEMNFFLSFSSCIFFFILLWNVWSALTQLCHRPSGCQWINSSLLPLLQYGRTPLHLAANNGSLEVVRHLCLTGANTEAITHVSHRAAYGLLFFLFFNPFYPKTSQLLVPRWPLMDRRAVVLSAMKSNEVRLLLWWISYDGVQLFTVEQDSV